MSTGLPVSRLVNVTVNLSPLAAQFANFNSLLIVGSSNVINVGQRIRSYGNIEAVADDFGTSAPEYKAALLFFSQLPQPTQLYIGRWAETATAAIMDGGVLSPTEQLMSAWTGISDGSFKLTIDGVLRTISALNFTAATNLNGVAAIINTGLSTWGGCTWNGQNFVITSDTTGVTSTLTYASATGSGTDIAAQMKMTASTASPPVDGIAPESPLEAVVILDDLQTQWYGLMFASTSIIKDEHVEIAAYIQATGSPHIYGVSTTDTQVLSAQVTDDIASLLKAGQYTRSFVQFSHADYVAASFFGRAFTVNFAGNNTTLTLMYKQEPGVAPLDLTLTQADTLDSKRCNYYVNYDNNTAILQNGTMSGPAFFDEIHGLDWLSNQIQTNVYNLLYTSPTKIPQTDAGTHLIVNTIVAACQAGVNNGLIAPGIWNSGGFGSLKQGNFLQTGYYVYAPPVAQQAQADREARKSVPIQVAVKLAGAIQYVDVIVLVNR